MYKQRIGKILRSFASMSVIYLSLTGSVLAAQDIFLRLGDIRGESRDDKHKDEIDVISWSWGAQSASMAARMGGGASGVRAEIKDISITKYIDKSSPLLMRNVATGQLIKDAILSVRKAGEKPVDYVRIKSANCIVTSVTPAINSRDNFRPTETITLNCARHEYEYTPIRPDGFPDAPIRTFFDLNANKFQ